jgi:hypothetical protein
MDDFDNFLYDDYDGGNDIDDEEKNFTHVKMLINKMLKC